MSQKEVTRGIRKYFELNENENMIQQDLWDAVKAMFRGKLIALRAYIRKEEESQTNLCLHFKECK